MLCPATVLVIEREELVAILPTACALTTVVSEHSPTATAVKRPLALLRPFGITRSVEAHRLASPRAHRFGVALPFLRLSLAALSAAALALLVPRIFGLM